MGSNLSQPLIKFKYVKYPVLGRGGAVRLFFLAQGLKFDEELYEMNEEWPKKKAALVAAGDFAFGPMVDYGAMCLTQHVAMMRYMALDLGLGSSLKGNYAQDCVADEYQFLRDAFVATVFGGGDKEAFLKLAKEKLQVLEQIYVKYGAKDCAYASVSRKNMPLWGDCALVALFRDMMWADLLHEIDLPQRLKHMYQAFMAIPAVKQAISS